MKKLMTLVLLLLSFTITAEWRMFRQHPTAASNDENYFFSVEYANDGRLNFYFLTTKNDPCIVGSTYKSSITSPVYFNNVLVDISSFCNNSGIIVYFPITPEGSNYIIRELYYKKQLVISDSNNQHITSVSAIGFQKTLQELISRSNN